MTPLEDFLHEFFDLLEARTGPSLCDDAYFESPIEREFGLALQKYISPGVELLQQLDLPTPWANFRADFALRLGDRVVVLECDGAEFHDPSRDEWRDAAILG